MNRRACLTHLLFACVISACTTDGPVFTRDAETGADGSSVCVMDSDCVATLPDTCNICVSPDNHLVCSRGACVCACTLRDAGAEDTGAGCEGAAPSCFGNDVARCCGNDPAGPATCVAGAWMCGDAPAPGCNGTSCLAFDAGADPDAGADDAGGDTACEGPFPLCFGDDVALCCGHDPAGPATCVAGAWMCGDAPAPGCNGTTC